MKLDVDIQVKRGEFLLSVNFLVTNKLSTAIVGPNGAGKSTLVDVLSGILPIDQGKILLDGKTLARKLPQEQVIALPPQQRNISVMWQNLALFPHLSVIENVAYGLRSRRIERLQAYQQAKQWLEKFSMANYANASPKHLSGGQAQRVALARALILQPKLLILDEPFSAFDAHTRAQAQQFLQEVLATSSSIKLIVTHNMDDVLALAEQVIVLENGKIREYGLVEEVLKS